ncbi:MAG: leucine-rich repeat protein, partial [Candidatus Ancillula sp.]|nr:leucine-rich repeat protein [Candidatus Ancillula sp.]
MWLMDKNAYRSSELAEKNSAENSASCKQLSQNNPHVAKSSTSIKKRAKNSLQKKDMRNFRNFHAKITPLIAVFALVAFSIFAFTKLPAFAQNSVQDLSENRVSCGGSAGSAKQDARDLSKTEVSRGGSAGSAEHEQDGTQTPSNEQVQDLNKTDVSRGGSAGSAEHEQDNDAIAPLNAQNGSAQSVPSNKQAQDAQDSVITPLDTQTEQNQQVQDNCVQTPSAGQDLESNSPITHLNTQNSVQVPSRVQSTTITPKASTGANIALSDGDETEASGAGWTYDSTTSVYIINSGADVTITGTTTNKRVVVETSATATVTLNGASITSSSGSPIELSSGANLTLKLTGSNVLTSNDTIHAGLNVPVNATITIQSATGGGISTEGSLTATGGEHGAGIGGGYSETSGTIIIIGGTIHATGMCNGGAGIGGGSLKGAGDITINGGIIYATGGDGAAGIGGGVLGDGGTIIINGGTTTVVGGYQGAGIGGGSLNSAGDITINGGSIIAQAGEEGGSGIGGGLAGIFSGGTVTISSGSTAVILATNIQGKLSSDATNGILIGDDVSISGTNPITITINTDMTIPNGATFAIPAGVKVVVPEDKTLTVAEGGTLDISGELDVEANGTLDIEDGSSVVIEDGGTVGKSDGSAVSDLSTQSITTTGITVNPVTLSSRTGQEVEYAISTTNVLPTTNWQKGTSFSGLAPDTDYYIFARSKENKTHKAGTAKQLVVEIAAQVAYRNATDGEHNTKPWWTFDSETGTLTINLENVYEETKSTTVEVVNDACGGSGADGAATECRLSIKHLAFTNTGSHVTNLNIGDGAFNQFPESDSTSLASISFPDGLTSMKIRNSAFYQYSVDNDTSLTSISFPSSLITLSIGDSAFYQESVADTSLTSISFPSSLITLSIGDSAFSRHSLFGSTSLNSVTFPASLASLNIGEHAFDQYTDTGTIAFKYAFLPVGVLPANTTVASDAFPSEKPIYWLGATGIAFGVLPTGDEGSNPILTQLPLTSLTATPEETTQTVAVNTPLSFTNVQAVYGGGENQPTFGPV